MPGNNRSDRPALLALALILSATVLVAGMTIYDQHAGGTESSPNSAPIQPSGQGEVADGISVAHWNPWVDPVDQWIAAIAGCLGTAISLAALIWLRKTWRETERTANAAVDAVKAAQEANAISAETARRQLRAYVTVEKINIKTFIVGRPIKIEVIIVNTGQTPAKAFQHGLILGHSLSEQGSAKLFSPKPHADSSKADIGAQKNYTLRVEGKAPLTQEVLDLLKADDAVLEIGGYCRYLDIFGKRHLHVFRAYMLFDSDGNPTMHVSPKHNSSN